MSEKVLTNEEILRDNGIAATMSESELEIYLLLIKKAGFSDFGAWDGDIADRCYENPEIARLYLDDDYKPSKKFYKKEMKYLENDCNYYHANYLADKYHDLFYKDEKEDTVKSSMTDEEAMEAWEFFGSDCYWPTENVPVSITRVSTDEYLAPWRSYKEKIKGVTDEAEIERLQYECRKDFTENVLKNPCNWFMGDYKPVPAI